MINFGNFDFSNLDFSDFDFSNVNPFPSTIDQVEETIPSSKASISEAYDAWFSSTEQGQRSNVTTTPDLLASLGMTAEELAAGAAKRDRDNAAAMSNLTPEMLARLEGMDLSGLGNGMMGGKPLDVGTFARENQYNDITQYNPVGTAPEDMVTFDDLNSPEALAAKSSREAELSESLQSWADPLKDLSKSDPAQFGAEYSALPLTGQLAYLKNDYDNGDMTEREYQDAFAEQWNASGNAGTLQFIDKYGWRMYAPDAIAQQGGQDPNGPMDWYETEGLFDGSIDRLDQFTPRVKETFDVTSIGRGVLASPVLRLAAGVMTGGLSEGAIAAGKGLTGDTLHASDWLSIGTAGLQMSGMMNPPVDAAAAADAGTAAMQAADAAGLSNTAAMAAGTAAQELALAGKGLTLGGKALNYKQSMGLLTAAATGDPKEALLNIYGTDLVKGGLNKLGATVDSLGDVQYNALSKGLNKVVSKVAKGEELDEALAFGLGTYIKEDGTFGNLSFPDSPDLDIDLKAVEDLVRDVVRPIGAIATDIAHFVEDALPDTSKAVAAIKAAGSVVDDEVLQPVKETVEAGASVAGDVLSAADTTARQGLSAFDDAITQPIGDAFSALDTAVRDALPSTSIDLPDVNLPSFGLPSLSLNLSTAQPAPNRTTDSLFKDELFKFQTEISADAEALEYVDLGYSDPFQDKTLLQRYPF